MSIRFHKGYWTVFSGEQPIAGCNSFELAWLEVWHVSLAMAAAPLPSIDAPALVRRQVG